MSTNPSLPAVELEFPNDFMFKVFGVHEASGAFEAEVLRAVNTVLPVPQDAMKSRVSAQGSYCCVSVLVRVGSMAQIEAIYTALRRVDGLKFLL